MSSTLLRQTWTISAVLVNMFGLGMMLSYPTSLLPALNLPDSPIKADLHSSSWLGSIPSVAGIPGFLISSVLMGLYGRRITHGLVILPGIIGWLSIYFAKDIPMLLIGRLCCGLTAMPAVSLGAIVIGEYTCPKYRGVFLNLKSVSVCMGVMCMHVITRFLHWRTIALISLAPLIIALLITCAWCESPAWLASKHQLETSREVFRYLRGDTEDARKEIEDIINAQKAKIPKAGLESSYRNRIIEFMRKLTRKDFVKPSLIMLLATVVLETSGRHIFPAYALHIMTDITGETYQSFYYTLGIDLIITVSAMFASIFVKIMNRRTLLFYSGFAAMAVLITFCLYISLDSKGIIAFDRPWIPNSLFVLYFVFANFGCTPIPLVLIGEVYPLEHREVGSALSGIWISISFLVALKSTPHLLFSIKVYGFYAVNACVLGICLLILYFILPETKDKSLQEIENYFNYGKFTIGVDSDKETKIRTIHTITI